MWGVEMAVYTVRYRRPDGRVCQVSGVNDFELQGLIQGLNSLGYSVVETVKHDTPPMSWNAQIFDANTRKIILQNLSQNWKTALTPEMQNLLLQRAQEWLSRWPETEKSYLEDMQRYPQAAEGLKKTLESLRKRAEELQKFVEGQGAPPEWFLAFYTDKVTLNQLEMLPEDVKKQISQKYGIFLPSITKVNPKSIQSSVLSRYGFLKGRAYPATGKSVVVTPTTPRTEYVKGKGPKVMVVGGDVCVLKDGKYVKKGSVTRSNANTPIGTQTRRMRGRSSLLLPLGIL